MTALRTVAPSPQSRRPSLGWVALYLLVAVWIVARGVRPGSSERIRELPYDALPLAGRDGMLLLAGPAGPNGIHGIPVDRGAGRLLVPPPNAAGPVLETWLTPTGAVFRTDDPPRPLKTPNGAPNARAAALGPRRARLWSAALDGGPARELLTELEMEGAVASGGNGFWLQRSGRSEPDGSQPRLRLMTAPLAGGRSREIWSGPAAPTWLEPMGGGVSWAVLRRGSFQMDRYVALPPNFDLELVPDCSGRPDVLDDRLYWLHSVPKQYFGGALARLELTTTRLDGGDRKVIADLLNSPEWLPEGRFLGVHRGRAYCLLFRRSRQSKSAPPTLCAIDQMGIQPLTTLRDEPGPSWFDEGYLYYTRPERRENWFNWSQAGLTLKTVRILHRVRLPHGG